jgi:CHAD domain-containing protein
LVKEVEKTDFKKIHENILHYLPGTLEESTIGKFIHRKVAAIHIILIAACQDKDLHSIRKNLKDIIYEIKIFKSDLRIPFPVKAWKSEKLLNDLATKLGDFNNQCILLSFLQSGYSKEIPAGEQSILENWRQSLIQQKEKVKEFLFQQVKRLQLVHDFQLSA